MNNMDISLFESQACESAPKIEINKEHESFLKHFTPHTIGCFLYALFYTFCLYRNMSGITYPFFIGGTLLYFAYYSKKYGVTAKSDNRFLWISMLILGTLTCLTDSWIFAFFNNALAFVLLCVLILDSYYENHSWDIGTHIQAVFYLCIGSLFHIFSFVSDFLLFRKIKEYLNTKTISDDMKQQKSDKKAKIKRIIFSVSIGLVLSFPAFIILLLLLCSADALFYELVCDIVTLDFLPEWEFNSSIFNIGIKIVFVFLLTYGVWHYLHKYTPNANIGNKKKTDFDVYIGITITGVTALLYFVFCMVQIFGLFLGKLSLPEGYTYASYARQGFFQLAFVCAFNIVLVLGCLKYFTENIVLKGILTFISICTYIMIFSSAYRMLLYINQYHLTLLRVFVLWCLVIMFIMMAGVIYHTYHRQFRLFRYFLTIITTGYILLSGSHPDYWIARYNVTYAEGIQDLDRNYLLYTLSLDTAPFIYSDIFLTKCKDWEWESFYQKYLYQIQFATEDMNWRTFNFSRAYARDQAYKIDPDNNLYFTEME
ncbi:MAG: DUF4173 domain-containing protein [Lachnospiraceae bacterium]|nr:DUF4173 domain-containing protein [Lachnospiraceae bacterium]